MLIFKVISCVCVAITKKYKILHSLWISHSPPIIDVFATEELMISVPNILPIITESPLTLFTINSIPIINIKICTPTTPPPYPPPLMI